MSLAAGALRPVVSPDHRARELLQFAATERVGDNSRVWRLAAFLRFSRSQKLCFHLKPPSTRVLGRCARVTRNHSTSGGRSWQFVCARTRVRRQLPLVLVESRRARRARPLPEDDSSPGLLTKVKSYCYYFVRSLVCLFVGCQKINKRDKLVAEQESQGARK